jgi:hypothetical protein
MKSCGTALDGSVAPLVLLSHAVLAGTLGGGSNRTSRAVLFAGVPAAIVSVMATTNHRPRIARSLPDWHPRRSAVACASVSG